jgi:hypothetical protein
MDAATEAKTTVEAAQRELRASGVKHTTRFFELRDDNCWVPRIQCAVFFFPAIRLLKLERFLISLVLLQASTGSTRGHRRNTGMDMVPVFRTRSVKQPSE